MLFSRREHSYTLFCSGAAPALDSDWRLRQARLADSYTWIYGCPLLIEDLPIRRGLPSM